MLLWSVSNIMHVLCALLCFFCRGVISSKLFMGTEVSRWQWTKPDWIDNLNHLGTLHLWSPQTKARQNQVHMFRDKPDENQLYTRLAKLILTIIRRTLTSLIRHHWIWPEISFKTILTFNFTTQYNRKNTSGNYCFSKRDSILFQRFQNIQKETSADVWQLKVNGITSCNK